jgi:hypothetical protein
VISLTEQLRRDIGRYALGAQESSFFYKHYIGSVTSVQLEKSLKEAMEEIEDVGLGQTPEVLKKS